MPKGAQRQPEAGRTLGPPAGAPPAAPLVDIPRLVTAYYTERPDPAVPAECVMFGTSGHRGSSLRRSFNEHHILAITHAICLYRREQHIDGPLFLGLDTHALSIPAFASALEVLAANDVSVMIAPKDEYTPTPVVSHAILRHNRARRQGLADGIVVTPSHNPPEDGGFKYNLPDGGPAGLEATAWIEGCANDVLDRGLTGIRRMPFERALSAPSTHRHDYLTAYVSDLGDALDLAAVREARVRIGVDPLGGAGIRYWQAVADRYRLNLTLVSDVVDPSFGFLSPDARGQIRVDPSSPSVMRRLVARKDEFDIAGACDPDHDRHGIVTPSAGLLPPNHYLAVAIDYLFTQRPAWGSRVGVGKTIVSSALIDRVAAPLGRRLYEVPVGFKWFVDGLLNGSLGFAGEESAGASFLRRDGTVWTTDKDGIVSVLLAAEITARTGRDPGEVYQSLTATLGRPSYERLDLPASAGERARLGQLGPAELRADRLAGEPIRLTLTRAPGNDAPIGGLKVVTEHAWFAARPSGTEDVLKIYAESFIGPDHLHQILAEAETLVRAAVEAAPP